MAINNGTWMEKKAEIETRVSASESSLSSRLDGDNVYLGTNADVSTSSDGISIGKNSTASGYYGTGGIALGQSADASNFKSIAIGENSNAGYVAINIGGSGTPGSLACTLGGSASGSQTCSVGNSSIASGDHSSVFGYYSQATAAGAIAVGSFVNNATSNAAELGHWTGPTTRVASVRVHPNGQVAMNIEDSATAPTDGGATAGAEADGTLPRSMFAIQKNGTAVTLYYNNGGTIQSLSLGTLA